MYESKETRMLTPIAKRIIVVAPPVEEKHGTLIVQNNKPSKFNVLAIGDEVSKVAKQPGDIIYLEKHYGVSIEHENVKLALLPRTTSWTCPILNCATGADALL